MGMKEIKEIDVMSLAKVSTTMGVVFGFLFGILLAIGATMPGMPTMIGGVIGIAAIVVLPIVYGIVGFIWGIIIAIVYNFIAKKIGGVKIKI